MAHAQQENKRPSARSLSSTIRRKVLEKKET